MNSIIALVVVAALAVFIFRDVVATPACEREFGAKGVIVDSQIDVANFKIECRVMQARTRPLSEKLWEAPS